LMGLVVASFVAATMASVASTLNSASTIVTMDIVKRFLPALSEARVVKIGKLSTAGFLLLAVIWASQLERFGSLWQYLQAVLAYAVPPVVALFGIGLFWRGANASGAFATIVLGSGFGLALFLSNAVLHFPPLPFLYAAREQRAHRPVDVYRRCVPRGQPAPQGRAMVAQLPRAGGSAARLDDAHRDPVPLALALAHPPAGVHQPQNHRRKDQLHRQT